MNTALRDIAATFVQARQDGRALADYPGAVPQDLATAYAIQDLAIDLMDEAVVGWKIGKVPPELVDKLNAKRIAGPVFASNLWQAREGAPQPVPVFEGGFAAVEAEFIFRMGADAPANKTDWTADEARALIGSLHVGIEMAGSPLATINALGSAVVASDFGNNFGLIVGQEIPNWAALKDEELLSETYLDGALAGRGSAASVLEGPLSSVVFLLGLLAERGRPLKAGQYITTGATTGIHDIVAGHSAWASFGPYGEVHCATRKAQPREVVRRAAEA